MVDQTSEILPRLQAARLPNFSLGGDFLYPAYDGFSILNLPATVCALLGAPPLPGNPPLNPALLAPLGEQYRRVILVLVDALAFFRLQRWMTGGQTSPVWAKLAAGGVFAPITSVAPSTTIAALTSLWSARSPAEHGLPGFELWLKEYGVISNMIRHTPINFRGGVDTLERAGFKPENGLRFPALGEHLKTQDVTTLTFHPRNIVQSSLSRMLLGEAEQNGYFSIADLWAGLRRSLERRTRERVYAYVYWDMLDTLGHVYGPDDERCLADFAAFGDALQRLLLERLSPAVLQDTLLILSADHGMLTAPPDDYYDLRRHPNLTRRLHMQPTGEGRFTYFYVRPGQVEAVREYIERTWPNQFAVVDSAFAVEAGLFGPGEPHPRLLERVGDVTVIAKGKAYLWWAGKPNDLHGRHGGLHPDEMLVPFLASPLYFT